MASADPWHGARGRPWSYPGEQLPEASLAPGEMLANDKATLWIQAAGCAQENDDEAYVSPANTVPRE